MRILFSSPHFVAIHKPSGFHVHPPENKDEKVPRHKICLYELRNQLGQKVYPVHRLDVGTSGVLLFALSSEASTQICRLFSEHQVEKKYLAVTRGYLPEKQTIDIQLELDSTKKLVDAKTEIKTIAQLELPFSVHPKYLTSRYSLIEANPLTGRYHQIRRHLNRISHPIIGDAQHGDSRHNRFIREQFQIKGLCLRAEQISFIDPWTQAPVTINAAKEKKWEKIYEIFSLKK